MNRPPNILFLCTDQHRHDYVGYRGAEWLHTPHIDSLARQGTVFTHCFTNSPVCGPARCALATGRQPHRIGCLDNGSFLPLSVPTFYQRLRDYGYWTGYCGKLDLAKSPMPGQRILRPDGRQPEDCAFGFCDPLNSGVGMTTVDGENSPYGIYLNKHGLLDVFNDDRKARMPVPGIVAVNNFGSVDVRSADMPEGWFERCCANSPLPAEYHPDAYNASRAIEWIQRADASGPWFLQVNFFGPHDPFDPPREYGERYARAEVPDAIPPELDDKPGYVGRKFICGDPEKIRYSRRQYSGAITNLDDQVGRILACLEDRGMRENTIIVFTSDHGEMLGDFGLYCKQKPYEASVRVPLVLCGPGVPDGKTVNELVEWIDLNPTLCELGGAPVLPDTDARSLLPCLRGESACHRESILSAISGGTHMRCVRDRRWKFVENHNTIDELYDLENDPEERRNLADDPAHAKTVKEMRQALKNRWSEGLWHH